MNKTKLALLIVLFLLLVNLLLCSCSIKPPNVYVFEDLEQHIVIDPKTADLIWEPSTTCMDEIQEPQCGHGVAIMSGDEVYIGDNANNLFKGKKWSDLKAESVYVPAVESYAPLSTYIINSCKAANCDSQVDQFQVKLNSLNGIVNAIENP